MNPLQISIAGVSLLLALGVWYIVGRREKQQLRTARDQLQQLSNKTGRLTDKLEDLRRRDLLAGLFSAKSNHGQEESQKRPRQRQRRKQRKKRQRR